MSSLIEKKCEPCEGGVPALARGDFESYLEQIDDWTVIDEKQIEKEFSFKNFAEALKFVNVVGEIAEDENHHPDILLHSWNKVTIKLWTHAICGLSLNDFIVAAKIDHITF
ncbi:MAG: 4a-hydroxytetrahydrobiopterin dehydratase [candidate division Zixibacteria bacterium]|nr:4a-hydroxytetrahydrobiopterin dehydratase [candidate division Zixibacteria bacterium]